MSRPATGSAAAAVSRATAARLLVLLLLLLLATTLATIPPRSFGNFDSALGPSSFGIFPLVPPRAAPSALPAVATEFVRQFSVAPGDEEAAPYRDTS